MRIDFLEYAAMDLPRKEPFTIARGSSTVAQNVMVVVHSGSLSGNGSGAPTDVTGETVRSAMDAIKTMARALEGFTFERAQRWAQAGFRALKVKIGRDPKADLDRLRSIRGAVGPRIELRIDGNQGYTWSQALSFSRAAKDLNISIFEQPVATTDVEGMRVLTESSPIPIMADEMVLTPDDAKKVRWANAAKAVNLKLMKHGGVCRAIDVN